MYSFNLRNAISTFCRVLRAHQPDRASSYEAHAFCNYLKESNNEMKKNHTHTQFLFVIFTKARATQNIKCYEQQSVCIHKSKRCKMHGVNALTKSKKKQAAKYRTIARGKKKKKKEVQKECVSKKRRPKRWFGCRLLMHTLTVYRLNASFAHRILRNFSWIWVRYGVSLFCFPFFFDSYNSEW